MFVIAGLGNPGSRYDCTRHNVGFAVIDALTERYETSPEKSKYDAHFSEAIIASEKVLLVKPQTFMNRSGESLQKILAFYKIPLAQLIVVHDDLDLAVGKIRIKQGGGAGGHNGLRSIDQHLGQNYHRVRIGIDHPGQKHLVEKYVLQLFRQEERPAIEKVVESIAQFFPHLLQGDSSLFMTRVNESSL